MVVGVSASLAVAVVPPASGITPPDSTPPSEPGTIAVSSVTSSAASLKWGASSDNVGIEGYRVYRGPASAADTALSLVATTDAVTSFSAVNLRSGYAYKFGVVAIDPSNNKSVMRTTPVTTSTSSDTTNPAAPSSSSVSVTAFSAARIDVVWGASTSTDVAYYQVNRDGALVGTVERPNSQRFSDNGLAASTSHRYTVVAVDSAGNSSSPTSAKSVTTLAATTVKIVRGPYLSNVTATSALVSWWTNIATSGTVSIAGQSVPDPAGSTQHHAVAISSLTAGTSYPYTVTSGNATGSGTVQTAASPGGTFSFAAIGDFGGQSSGESQNATNIGTSGTQFIQTLGDNVYPSAGLPDPNFSTTYSDFDARFFKQFGPVVKSQAFFPANGNKEYYGDGEFWDSFPMPGTNHSWYSYDWGDAHILVLDSERPFASGTDQYNFAQADLAAHQNDPWRIVAIQRPPYSSTTANSSSKPVQQYLVSLFESEHVDLVLSGNSHNYERSFPLVGGNPVTTGGIVYVVSGAGGNGFNAFNDTTFPRPAWSAMRESSYYEYAKVTVSPTALTVAAVRADTNAVFDTTTISKAANPVPDTVIDSGPNALTNIPSATFSFHSTLSGASFACSLDGATATPCVSPQGYTGLADGAHSLSVTSTSAVGVADPSPAVFNWTVDTTAPAAPASLAASPASPTTVNLSWTGVSDAASYTIIRDGNVIGSAAGSATSYADNTASPSTTYTYGIEAVDAAGNPSPLTNSPATTTPAAPSGPLWVQTAAGTATATVTSLTASFGTPTVSGHLLVLSASVYAGATNNLSSVTDSAGNTWTKVGAYVSSGHFSDGELWYTANAKPTTTVTVKTGSAASIVFQVLEFSGIAASSPLDTSIGTSNTGTVANSGNLTPAASTDLVVGFLAGHGNQQTMGITTPGFTAQPQATTTGTFVTVRSAYEVLSSTSPIGIAGSFSSSMYWAAGVAAFKAG